MTLCAYGQATPEQLSTSSSVSISSPLGQVAAGIAERKVHLASQQQLLHQQLLHTRPHRQLQAAALLAAAGRLAGAVTVLQMLLASVAWISARRSGQQWQRQTQQ